MNTQHTEPRFAICVNSTDYPDDLKVRTVYRILPDESAAKSHYLRVVDETGEDYLYRAEYFVFVDLPREATDVLLAEPRRRSTV